MRVIVADDDRTCRRPLEAMLVRMGHEVIVCSDGTEALQALQRDEVPQIALLDWMMPGMDGIDVCRKTREAIRREPVYIIFVTGQNETEDIATGLQAGADDYLTKPVNLKELRVRVSLGVRVLELQGSLLKRVAETEGALQRLNEHTTALHESQAQLNAVVQGAHDGIITMDGDGIIRDWNPAATRIFGWTQEQAVGQVLCELIVPAEYREAHRKGLRDYLAGGHGRVTGKRLEMSAVRASGEEFPIELSITPAKMPNSLLFSAFIRDVTEQKRLEVELRHAQKLESVGQLAAGIAHEINTPTQYVGDNVRFLQDAFNDMQEALKGYDHLLEAAKKGVVGPGVTAEVEAVLKAADVEYLLEEIPKAILQSLEGVDRVAKIVRAMKEFSHPGGEEKTPVDINRAIGSTITVSRNEWKYVADMVTDLDPDLPSVSCLPGDFNQVILNIIVNAAHAIIAVVGDGAKGKGTITVSTRHDNGWAEIRISDTGTGIPKEVRTRIFDPFFTTKEIGRGTGQGLAIARSVVVDKHGGTLTFETEPGKGTTFIIRLPVAGSVTSAAEMSA